MSQQKALINRYARKYPKKKPKSYTTIRCNRILDFLRWLFNYKCALCQAEFKGNNLDFAHVRHTPLSGSGDSRGKYWRVRDILQHPDCYTCLCTPCHWDLDRNSNEKERDAIIAKLPTVLDRLHAAFKLLA